jgi:hypothetical protein
LALQLSALTFNVEFTPSPSAEKSWFTVEPDPGNGDLVYDSNTLPGNMDFRFDLGSYGIFGPSDVQYFGGIRISGSGPRQLAFIGNEDDFSGSLQLLKGEYSLTFAPDFLGFSVYEEVRDNGGSEYKLVLDGKYLATAVPDTAGTGWLAMLAFPLLAFAQRRCQGRRASVG